MTDKFYELRISSDDAGRCVFDTPRFANSASINPWIFSRCEPWHGIEPLLVDFYRRGRIADLNMTAYGNWLISARFGEQLRSLIPETEVQLVPCVTADDQRLVIMNPLQAVDCLDLEASEGVRYFSPNDPGGRVGIQSIASVAIKAEVADGYDVFRISRYMLPILVSDRFRNILRLPRDSGALLTPIRTGPKK